MSAAMGAQPVGQASNIERLRQSVRDRDALRAEFAQVWPRVSGGDAAVLDGWARASLTLLQVNAGPAVIVAYWRAAAACGHGQLGTLVAAGHATAEICRLAGARAALACVEALPVAIRLTLANPIALSGWWRGLERLATAAPDLVREVARRVETLLAGGDGVAFADFVAAGLKAAAGNKARRAAYFSLNDPLARALLARPSDTNGFAAAERMLHGFVAGLWGGEPRLRTAPSGAAHAPRRTMIASGTIVLPPVFAGAPAGRMRELYRAAAAHAQAHLVVPDAPFALLSLKPLQVALIGLIEDARVETLAIRQFPGLRRLWASFHQAQPDGAVTAADLMARLARALLDPDYADPNGFVQKGREMFAAAGQRLSDPALSRTIGGLLGNDLGQMRVQFNAKTYVVEPAYRDDNMHLWDVPDAPDDTLSLTVDSARGGDGGAGEQHNGDGGHPHARESGHDERGTVLASYPEWDAAAGRERPDWTVLRDAMPRLREPDPVLPEEVRLRSQVARLLRGSVVGQPVRQPRQEDGEQLDLSAAIDAVIARRAGLVPDGRVFRDRRARGRDLSTLIILDVSQSTASRDRDGRSVLAAERVAVGALAAAMELRGDCYALRAFASAGREDVRLIRLKEFDEPFSDVVDARLAGLSPGLSTRLGAALRHAGAELAPLPTARKLVLVLTDGEPSDIDVCDPRELIEDARRAVRGLRFGGIDVFGIIMDPDDAGSGAAIFGRHHTLPVRRLADLPVKLAGVYFRLAQR